MFKVNKDRFNPLLDIHKKYGHLSESRIKLAYKRNLVKDSRYSYADIKDLKLSLCPDCMRGRMKAFPGESTTDHPWKVFQKIAMDYKGPFKKKSHAGYNGFYLFSDYNSDFVWAYPVKHKNEGGEALEAFYRANIGVSDSAGDHEMFLVLQSDRDSVAKSDKVKRWMESKGIVLQMSAAYKYNQNGQIERDMQNVLDKTRTLLASYDVPVRWWVEALQNAIWNINRSPTSKHNNKSPLEQAFGIVPNADEMIPFFCPGMYQVTKDEREPDAVFKWKARACRFLGHDKE